MSARKYCSNNEPHEGHEWYEEGTWLVSGDWFYCDGVEDHPDVRLYVRDLELRREQLSQAEARLAEVAAIYRRKPEE